MRRQLCLLLSLTGTRLFGFAVEPNLSPERVHIVTGEPARIERATAAPAASDITVVTWNIEQGLAFDKVLTVLRGLNPDVVLLQEVDNGCRRTGYRNVARDLGAELGMNWILAGEFQEIGEGRRRTAAISGQAILSRYRIDDAAPLPFEAQARWRWSLNPMQPRRGGRLALKARTAGIQFYNTHIESGTDERLQARQMSEIVSDQTRIAELPVIVAGDFNNRGPSRSQTVRSLTSAAFVDALGDSAGRGPTSLGQPHPIDWIFVRRLNSTAGRVVDAPSASDHFPVVTSIAVQQQQTPAQAPDGQQPPPKVKKPPKAPAPPLFPKHRRGFYRNAEGIEVIDAMPQSPPLKLDDPDVPDPGEYEVNVLTSFDYTKEAQQVDLLVIDANYGLNPLMLGRRWPTQVKLEVPLAGARTTPGPFEVGVGSMSFGVKLNVYSNAHRGFSMSVYPQLEFPTPGAHGVAKGLSEEGQTIVLPVLLAKELHQFSFVVNGTFEQPIHDAEREAATSFGVGMGRPLTRKDAVMVELGSESSLNFKHDRLLFINGGYIHGIHRIVFYLNIGHSLFADGGIGHTYFGGGIKLQPQTR
jgi:endonuclease/exonuclease/phosphatase family metal-dependent hydrolase